MADGPTPVTITQDDGTRTAADLTVPASPVGVVVFAHGTGSSRLSPRNQLVAAALNERRIATLLLDLLTPEEDEIEERGGRLRFDVELLARRLVGAVASLRAQPSIGALPFGYFGASTGAGAALIAAARDPAIAAVVSRSGRPDLAGEHLANVRAPTLLIVGSEDEPVIQMNLSAQAQIAGPCELEVVAGATHLFPEPGTLEEVIRLAGDWFSTHLEGRR